MNRERRPRSSRILAVLLLAAPLLLGGCVYLRLWQFKQQLGSFDKNFSVETGSGLGFICQRPVLLADDLRWLGVRPETVEHVGSDEFWTVRWVKQMPSAIPEDEHHDIELKLVFSGQKFTRLSVDRKYFSQIPKPFYVALLRSLGSASINKLKRRAEARVLVAPGQSELLPTPEAVASLLGEPTSERHLEDAREIHYRFGQAPAVPGEDVFDLYFTFATADGRLTKLYGHSTVGTIAFDFEPAPALVPGGHR